MPVLKSKRFIRSIDRALHSCVFAILLLSAVLFLIVFIINWEDWFFGTKLAGPAAGITLLAKCLGATVLVVLFMKYPKRRQAVTGLAVLYFGFLFLDSAGTIQSLSGGHQLFSPALAIVLIIPILSLIIGFIASQTGSAGNRQEDGAPAEDAVRERTVQKVLLVLAGLAVIILLGPVLVSLAMPALPFAAMLAVPPAHDTILTKVSVNGTTEWQTLIDGYSMAPVGVVPEPDGGHILYGSYWIPGETQISSRVMKLDRTGTVIWDFRRSAKSAGQQKTTIPIAAVRNEGEGYLVVFIDESTIRLDQRGGIIGGSEQLFTDTGTAGQTGTGPTVPFYTGTLPSDHVTVRTMREGKPDSLFTIEDLSNHAEIAGICSVNPAGDGGYIVSGSVKR